MKNIMSGKVVVFCVVGFFVFATSVRSANAADVVVVADVLSANERVVQQCAMVQAQPQQYQQPAQYQQQASNDSGSFLPGLFGAIAGAAVGNQVGKGNGKMIATTVGAVAGGLAGASYGGGNNRQQAQQAPQQQAPQQQCSYRTVGYEVVYQLKDGTQGRGFVPYRPGNTINVGLTAM